MATKILTYEDCEKFFEECKNYWIRSGDSEGVATCKAFWWDFVECMNFDKSWNDAKRKFAMDWRGYVPGDPVPEAEYVERGAV